MKTFLVTRTTVETFKVDAESQYVAENASFDVKQPSDVDDEGKTSRVYKVAELLDKPEYRIQIVHDLGYEYGDYCDEQGIYTPETQEAGKAEVDAIIERDGVWGYIVESRTTVDGEWEHVDSCFGFLGNDTDYMMSCAIKNIPEGTGEVSVVNERGQEINAVTI